MRQAAETISERLDRFNGKPDHGNECQCAVCEPFNVKNTATGKAVQHQQQQETIAASLHDTPATTGVQASTYYVVRDKATGLLELRQERFRSNPDHPHDICAIARNVEEMRNMAKMLTGTVDYSAVEPNSPTTGVHTATKSISETLYDALRDLTTAAETLDDGLHAGLDPRGLSVERSVLHDEINRARAALRAAEGGE